MMRQNSISVFLSRKIIAGLVIVFLATWMVSALLHSASRIQKEGQQTTYLEWIGGVLTFNLGKSSFTGKPISGELLSKGAKTFVLTLGSLVISLLFSLPLGIVSASKRDSRLLKLLTGLTDFVCSTPVFVTGYLFILLGLKVFQQNFAAAGEERSSFAPLAMFLTLGLGNGTVSEIMRHTREEAIKILEQSYIKAIVARGVSLKKHFTKSMFIPLLNIVSSRIVYLLSGAIVVEYVFNWEGIGKWSWDAALKYEYLDYPVVMNITFIMVIFVLLVRLSNSLVAAYVDSRRR